MLEFKTSGPNGNYCCFKEKTPLSQPSKNELSRKYLSFIMSYIESGGLTNHKKSIQPRIEVSLPKGNLLEVINPKDRFYMDKLPGLDKKRLRLPL
jgi:hypothetical protein